MSFFQPAAIFNFSHLGGEATAAREETAQKAREERKKEIQAFAEDVAKMEGFPSICLADFVRRNGSLADYIPVMGAFGMQLSDFEGSVTIGTEPEFGGYHCDFEEVAKAVSRVPLASTLFLREGSGSQSDNNNNLIAEFETIGVKQEDLAPTVYTGQPRSTIACIGQVKGVDPSLPMSNLQVLHLDGDVLMQQITLQSGLLREIVVSRNSCITMAAFLNLQSLRKIKFDRCPGLSRILVEKETAKNLTKLSLHACQSLDCAAAGKVVEDSGLLDELDWSDMFLLPYDGLRTDFRPRLDFLSIAAKHTQILRVDRFRLNFFGAPGCEAESERMATVIDAALCELLSLPSLQAVAIRGSTLFTTFPLLGCCSVRSINMSSCKLLQEVVLYETTPEDCALTELILDDCPVLKNLPLMAPHFSGLNHLSCQGCPLLTNDLLIWLPATVEHLDVTGCTGIGSFKGLSYSASISNLRWCSFKQTSVTSADLSEWTQCATSLKYLNLGNLTLDNLSMESKTLETLLMLNVDISSKFQIICPQLEHLWIGNRYRGWPYAWHYGRRQTRTEKGSACVHGESLAQTIAFTSASRHLKIYLPEEVEFSFGEKVQLQFSVESFWETGYEPSDYNGLAFFAKWKDTKAEKACTSIKELLLSASQSKPDQCGAQVQVVVTRGLRPRLLAAPILHPKAPDAKWRQNYIEAGLGGGGDYSGPCEANWYG